MSRLVFKEGYDDGNDGEKYDDKFSEITPHLSQIVTIWIPPPPGADVDVHSEPYATGDDSLMCNNKQTNRDSSSQVWWPAGPMRRLAPKHPKLC